MQIRSQGFFVEGVELDGGGRVLGKKNMYRHWKNIDTDIGVKFLRACEIKHELR